MIRWCDLSKTERAWVIGAIRAGVSGDLLLKSGRWYRIKGPLIDRALCVLAKGRHRS